MPDRTRGDVPDPSREHGGVVDRVWNAAETGRSRMQLRSACRTRRWNGFVARAAAEGMVELTGHRSVGGIRASIYNAVPVEAVRALRSFMERFRTTTP